MEILFFILALMFTIIIIRLLFLIIKFKNSHYKEASGNSLLKIIFNKGIYGEFLTYSILKKSGENRILCNVYLTKSDGKTTEIDLISINTTGIFVHESKNYSGWIFGDEKNKNWTQSLQNKQKNKFYNPILQNKGHIKAINEILEGKYSDVFLSYIIFSERCELKKIKLTSENVRVFKRNKLSKHIIADKSNIGIRLTIEQVDQIYYLLKQYTLQSDEVKKKHIQDLKNSRM